MEITMEMVKKLRDETHAGIMDCKKALAQSNGDFAGAAKYLKEVGLAAVAKRADRATEEGRITFKISSNKAVMVSVTCETDFVARNDQFKALGEELCEMIISNNWVEVNSQLEDKVKELIATIHENMTLKNMIVYDITDNTYVQGYNHGDGKIGVLVQFSASDKSIFEKDAFKTFAANMAMHVCAADPMYLNSTSVPKDYEEEQLSIFRTQVASMDKPEKVKEGIVMGKLKKHYEEICLMNQVGQLSNDDNLTVEQIINKFNKDNSSDVKVVSYSRFRAGA